MSTSLRDQKRSIARDIWSASAETEKTLHSSEVEPCGGALGLVPCALPVSQPRLKTVVESTNIETVL